MLGGIPLWVLVQNHSIADAHEEISPIVYKGFQSHIRQVSDAAILIESPGGSPESAFRIARLFQRRTQRLTVLVPQYAKSAATLLALSANTLVLGRDAELGPLDLQVYDVREETIESALNSVQALERLGAYALTAVDQAMTLFTRRLRKRSDILLPMALKYVTDLLRPLLEKVDTTDYARKSRDLKMAEEYAARLMRKLYGFSKSKEIARQLVQNYPDHGFVIDRDEVMAIDILDDGEGGFGLGIRAEVAPPRMQALFDEMVPWLDSLNVVGEVLRA
jgi:hypothetical protein